MMNIRYSIVITGLLLTSCSHPIFHNEHDLSCYLQPDTIAVNNFISRIENRMHNYTDSSKKYLSAHKDQIDIKKDSSYYRQYPNPFSPTTTINLHFQNTDTVKMTLYTINAIDSCIVYSGPVSKGESKINIIKPSMADGVYYLVTQGIAGEKKVLKIMLLK